MWDIAHEEKGLDRSGLGRKSNDIENRASTNVMQSLQGRVPGVFITSNGSPDGAASVMIRGVSTLGEHDPLYIIDGMPSTEA